jgi:predicted transcriptional regulator
MDEDGVKYSLSRLYSFNISTAQYITFWSRENKDPLTIGTSSTIATIFFVGLAYTETGRYKLLALLTLAFPMLANTEKEDILDQFVRGQIYGYIKTNPGTHYNQIMRELDIKNGTLSYHLYVLEKTGVIKSRMEHMRYRAFYTTDMKFPEEERYRLTDLQMKILELIHSNKGTNQKQLVKKLNETHQTISYNIKVLEQAGLISVVKKGRKTHCYIREDLQAHPHISFSENSAN